MDDRSIFLDRLDGLAARLEMEGRYTDALLVASAYIELSGSEPPLWRVKVNQIWPEPKLTKQNTV